MGVILMLSVVACNRKPTDQNKLPDEIGGPGNNDGVTVNGSAALKFYFPIEMSSVFNSIFADEFDLETYVEYSVVYFDEYGAPIREVPQGGVTMGMVAEEDQPKLSVAGHHNIRCRATLDDKSVVDGSFALHLKDRSGAVSLVDYTFNLIDTNGGGKAHAYFGRVNSMQSTATVSVVQGAVIESWSDFINTFKMGLSGKALESVTTDKGVTLSATEGFPFTIGGKTSFTTAWTDDVVRIKFDINKPANAVLQQGAADPSLLFEDGGKYADMTAQRRVGRIIQPEDKEINVYNGFYFAGWFDRATDTLWRFSSSVGEKDIELYAKWTAAEYSFTLYTMGGVFADNIAPAKTDDGTTITVDNAASLGYKIVSSTTRFSLTDGSPNRITFTGFHYDVDYDEYVSEVTLNPAGDKVLLKFSDVYLPDEKNPIFVKGGDCLKIDDLYNDYQCTNVLVRKDKVDVEQPVTYIKWLLDEPDEKDEQYDAKFLEKISKLYTEVIFKDGYTVLADGSVRLDKISDYALNELIVPANLFVRGQVRPLTEIGEWACSNVRSLTKVDLSRAENLTSIGANAFALDAYLKDIVMPVKNSISDIGDNAFMSTDFEDNYYENNKGAEFIVINKMIYKYVGADKAIIDLSRPEDYYNASNAPNMSAVQRAEFNAQLSVVERIEDGAFENCKSLVSITIPRKITTIENYAFKNLDKFESLVLPSQSKLSDIGEYAFEGSRLLGKNSNLYKEAYGAILIGNVYYRFIETSRDVATVPEDNGAFKVTTIAPKAFMNCGALQNIFFEKEDQIVKIGTDAFLDTKFIQSNEYEDEYTTVNGILTNYYAPENDANMKNLIVPSRVSEIGSNAFGQYARYFRTVQINANVKKIDNFAFSGADMLVSVIFPDVAVAADEINLINAPAIGDVAFANSKGEMPQEISLFFSTKVMELFGSLAADEKLAASANPITRDWVKLYKLHTQHFKEEDISLVAVNKSTISSVLMRTRKDDPKEDINPFTTKYGKEAIDKALIITSTTGVAREEALSWTANAMQFVEVTETGDYASLYEEGVQKYVLLYQYNGSGIGCPSDADDPELFVIKVYDAIKGQPDFFQSDNYPFNETPIEINGLNKDNSNFWMEGLDGQVEDAPFPTFYTSTSAASVIEKAKFAYKDINGITRYADSARIDGFSTNAIVSGSSANVTVDFHGIGIFRFDYKFSVTVSKFNAIEQSGAIVIPINGNATTYLRLSNVNLVGQDGIKKEVPLSMFIIDAIDGNTHNKVVNTTELGIHTMTVRYEGVDAYGAPTIDIYYTVVLEADESLFTYQIINGPDKTARIIGCSAKNVETIVVPSTCTIDGQVYDIVQIGYFQDQSTGVFQNFENLRAVYLPESIVRLGTNSFAGCRRLANVYASIQSKADKLEIPATDKYFQPVGEQLIEKDAEDNEWTVLPVELITLDGLEYGNELIIKSEYIVNEQTHLKYRLVGLADNFKVNKPASDIDIYLPDSVYKEVSILDVDDKEIDRHSIKIFTSGSDFVFKTENHVPKGLQEVKNGVFRGCEQLTSLDFSHATGLNLIGAMTFAGSGLESIDFSKNTNLKEINHQLFNNAVALKSVVFHSGIVAIGDYVFAGCVSLESVTGYGDALSYIGNSAFAQCTSLTRVDIYNGTKQMGSSVFSKCGALTIYCHFDQSALNDADRRWNSNWNGTNCPVVWNCDNNEIASDGYVYVIVDGIRYALNPTAKTATVAGQRYTLSDAVVIPEYIVAVVGGVENEYTVTSIGAWAFDGNDRITSVEITYQIKTIEQYAFQNCTLLTSFIFEGENNGLTYVSTSAFFGCNSLAQKPTVKSRANGD